MDAAKIELRERSARLRHEALSLLSGGTRAVLDAALGPVEVAGSVALDLMVWPDIDLFARVEASRPGTHGPARGLGLLEPAARF